MRVQSDAYAPFRPVRRIGIRAEIALIDADAKPNASASAVSSTMPSSPAQTIDGITQNPQTFATFERNAWLLDGSCAMMDASASDLGWWSRAVSGTDGAFADEMYIEYQFAADAKTVGLVLHFMPGYHPAAGGMRIRTYDTEGAIVQDVYNDACTPVQEVLFTATYRRMRIDFIKTALPGRRIRFLEIDFGVTQRFDEDSVAGAEIRYKTDLASASLPFGQCRITVDNSDKRWNLLNPAGIYQYLEEGQKVSVWLTVNGEDVYMGAWSFYSVEAKDGALTAQITAVDPIASLDDGEYNGGRCSAAVFSDAIAEVLDGTGITCVFDGDIGDAPVMLCVPTGTKKREAVRMLTQAAMGCAFADRDGNLRFARLGDPIALASSDGYTLFDADGLMLTVGSLDAVELTPNELYNYDGVTISETVGQIRLVVNDTFSGTEAEYTAGTGGKTKTVKNPCVSGENGAEVAQWLLDRYKRRKMYNVKNRCDPAAELLDAVRIYDAYDQNDAAVITAETIHYDGGIYAETEAIG